MSRFALAKCKLGYELLKCLWLFFMNLFLNVAIDLEESFHVWKWNFKQMQGHFTSFYIIVSHLVVWFVFY
jgi:hypothetical protein